MPARDRRDAFDVNVINTRGNLIGNGALWQRGAFIEAITLAIERNATLKERSRRYTRRAPLFLNTVLGECFFTALK